MSKVIFDREHRAEAKEKQQAMVGFCYDSYNKDGAKLEVFGWLDDERADELGAFIINLVNGDNPQTAFRKSF